ncbi:endonuclease NucS domain-containing protein [Oceanidesulfovibrio marinus]|uniref:DUF91 domain-containing protein n=1 Tax=Oceanidesulfovibrio marinus TaxID=370038 RepID=A0A6P1ZDR4_9BACT|nr:endonuclease NucS domain-containing protein [Oceanidesulfovibrio marinus]QJT08572.1 DUF91 domain-containing protein [Oceanidesulfovibrio marinus]TVM32594.1 DUF91 domain-containing protein [Oceanidesulfovibrio marinus]
MAIDEETRNTIISLMQNGLDDHEIGNQLDISPYTVRAVRAHITMGTYGSSPTKSEEYIEAEEIRFGLEKDLQQALRRNIKQLEPGLSIIDNGKEHNTDAGFIDILCKDDADTTVVIELKAGQANDTGIAQTLGYMGALKEEGIEKVRGIIVAADFSRRSKFAVKALPNLKLVRYGFSFVFEDATL